jgi:hypothetical protein
MEPLHRNRIERRTDSICDRQRRRGQQELVNAVPGAIIAGADDHAVSLAQLNTLKLGGASEMISRNGVARFETVESVVTSHVE